MVTNGSKEMFKSFFSGPLTPFPIPMHLTVIWPMRVQPPWVVCGLGREKGMRTVDVVPNRKAEEKALPSKFCTSTSECHTNPAVWVTPEPLTNFDGRH